MLRFRPKIHILRKSRDSPISDLQMIQERTQKTRFNHISDYLKTHIVSILIFSVLLSAIIFITLFFSLKLNIYNNTNLMISKKISAAQKEYADLKNQNQYKINQKLETNIKNRSEEHTSELQSPLNLVCRL